ncbi:MAG: ABC transporter permease [Pseudomonadota bacterium]|nr:ABC transporter permease [Pseudomonadota bacterium]
MAFIKKNGIWLALFLMVFFLTIKTNGDFLSARNITNLIRQTSINGILACGMTLVILTGGIDLSIGSVVGMTGVLVGLSQINWGLAQMGLTGAWMSALLSVAFGTLAGGINGGLIAYLGITPFIVTLGTMVIARGMALIFSGGTSIAPLGESVANLSMEYLNPQLSWAILAISLIIFLGFFRRDLKDKIFLIITLLFISYGFMGFQGVPYLGLMFFFTVAFCGWLLKYTVLGRSVYAVGSNERAALWAGVPTARIKFFVYTFIGFLAGLCGVLTASRINGANPNEGQLFELDAIAAVVIGGTRLTGGVGTILGTFVGALTIATLNNGMDHLGVPDFYRMVFKGLIIILAVGLDKAQRNN